MTESTPETPTTHATDAINLPAAAAEVLQRAHESSSGRAGQTLNPGTGTALKHTLLALVAGQSLADHESPAAATLQVVRGVVRLTSDGQKHDELHPGDHAPIPPVRHGVDAIEDAVLLITVAQGARP